MQPANPTVMPSAVVPPRPWRLSQIIAVAVTRVLAWDAMSRSRKGLGRLDAHMLRDIGLDATTAQEQATRAFWR
jgi:uncharacterized protein YjiS (DUF1127 family)